MEYCDCCIKAASKAALVLIFTFLRLGVKNVYSACILWHSTLGPADLLTRFAMQELLALWAVVVIFLICRRIISCCRNCNDEYDRRRPILVSSSRNVSYIQGSCAPIKSISTVPSYNDRSGHSRPFQPSSSHNIPDTQYYAPTKSTVKTLTISKHGRNVSSTSRIPPPRAGPSSVKVLSNALLSEEGEYVTDEYLREKARRMMREEKEALNLARQARQRRDFSAAARHKQDARVRKCAMESLNKAAATAIFNQKNKVLWPILSIFQSHGTQLSLWY